MLPDPWNSLKSPCQYAVYTSIQLIEISAYNGLH